MHMYEIIVVIIIIIIIMEVNNDKDKKHKIDFSRYSWLGSHAVICCFLQ
jgi:hypothetical protein